MPRLLRSVDDLTEEDVDAVLAAAARPVVRSAGAGGPLVGLIFLEASLRTRVGFAAAAARLGGGHVEVGDRRHSPTSMGESLADTIATVSDYTDVVVVRPGVPLDPTAVAEVGCPVVNGGDAGPAAEHPTQALIDLFALQRVAGDVADLTVAVCGDLRMRAARSLLKLLGRRPPAHLVVITDDALLDPSDPVIGGLPAAAFRQPDEVEDVDVLYVAGMPHEALALPARERLIVDDETLRRLPSHAVVLSPMPVIDEIAPAARRDRRMAYRRQSGDGLAVRAAVLEHLSG
ncbi:MAG TPA: hypothetical protein VGO60_08365 [Iamia sp.]|nr:hypothetical protein [Iamia sp.]